MMGATSIYTNVKNRCGIDLPTSDFNGAIDLVIYWFEFVSCVYTIYTCVKSVYTQCIHSVKNWRGIMDWKHKFNSRIGDGDHDHHYWFDGVDDAGDADDADYLTDYDIDWLMLLKFERGIVIVVSVWILLW